MNSSTLKAQAQILIRRPPGEVYQAFVQPQQLTRFWLSASSAPLEVGRAVRWDFMVPGATAMVTARTLEEGRRIVVEFEGGGSVEWLFEPHGPHTIVRVTGVDDDGPEAAIESTQGHTIVLCDLKTLLESGVSSNLVRDKALLIQVDSDSLSS